MVRFKMGYWKKSVDRFLDELSTIPTITKIDSMAITSSLCEKNSWAESGISVCLAKPAGLHTHRGHITDSRITNRPNGNDSTFITVTARVPRESRATSNIASLALTQPVNFTRSLGSEPGLQQGRPRCDWHKTAPRPNTTRVRVAQLSST